MRTLALKFEKSRQLFFVFVFLYFLTLSSDRLNLPIVFFKFKMNHGLAIGLCLLAPLVFRFFSIRKSLFICFLSILSSMLLSACFSVAKERSFGYVMVFLFEFFCYFLIPLNLIMYSDHKRLFNLYWISFVCVGLHAISQLIFSIFGIIDPFVGQFLGRFARPQAMTYEPSYYALYMCAFVMFYNMKVLLNGESIFNPKKLLKLFFVNLLLIISTSTGAFFAYFIFFSICLCISLFGFLKKHVINLKKKILPLLVFFSGCFLLFALAFPKVFFETFFKFFTGAALMHHSFVTRWNGIVSCWEVFMQYPLFGVGVGGVGPYLYYERIANPNTTGNLALSQMEGLDPSNVFTEVLASLGLFGLFAFSMLGWRIFRLFKQLVSLPALSQEERNQAIALFVSLVVSILVLQFNPGLFRTYIWVQVGMTVGFFLRMLRQYRSS